MVALSAQLRVNFEANQNGRRIGTVAATEENVAEMCEGGVLQCQILCGGHPV